jgi:hypothetical protein
MMSTQHLLATLESVHEWVLRPRVRLTLIGVGLLLIGGLMLTNSVWTLPLVIVGALMVAIAWVGHRLEGRFAVQWGESGTELAFRARIRAPAADRTILLDPPSTPDDPTPGKQSVGEREGVIDGSARTVEIEVAELEALIAAAERRDAEGAPAEGAAKSTDRLRVAYGGPRRSDQTP